MAEEKALPPAILIAGVDQTRKTRAVGSLRIDYQLGARATAALEILDRDSTQAAYRPTLDQRLEIKSSDGRSLFRGYVKGIEDQPLGAPGVSTVTQLDAIDDWFGAAQRRVSRIYVAGSTLKSIVSDLVTTYLTVYGITLDPAMATGPTLPAVTFDQLSLEEAFNRLVDLSGWVYRLRPTGVLEWFAIGTKTRSFTLSAANKNIIGPITWTKSRGQYANRIILRYGTGLVGKQQLWHGAPPKVRFKPDYPPTWPVAGSGGQPAHWIGWMTYVGGPYPGPPTPTVPPSGGGHEAIADISTGTAPWYWDPATSELVRHVGVPIPGGSAQIPATTHYFWLDYNVQYPLTVTAEDASAATVPYEALIERADIFDKNQAQAYANAQLAKYQVIPRTVTLKTRAADDILPGDTVRLDIPSRTLPNALWFVTEVSLTVEVDQAPMLALTLLEGTVAQASWLDFWRDIASGGSSVGVASAGSAPPLTAVGTGTVNNYGDLTLYALTVGMGDTGIAPLTSLGLLGQVLKANPSGPPTWGALKLDTDVTGVLPIPLGGTGQTTKTNAFDALAPTTTKGDLIGFNGTDNVRLPVGPNSMVLVADSASPAGVSWQTPAGGGATLPLTTKGDLLTHNGAAHVRLPVGAPGQRLTADPAAAAGVAWQTVTGGTGGGMNLDYLGDYAPGPVYNDGDIVIGADGIAYMCVVDGTTTPPEPWPGVGVAFNAAVDASYWVTSGHSVLTNERVMSALANGYVKSTAGEPSTVAIIPVADGGTGASTAALARTNLGIGTVGPVNLSGDANTFLNGAGAWTSPSGVPVGAIIFMTTPCPAGYTRVAAWDGYYVRMGPTNVSGGAATHTHAAGTYASQAHTHGSSALTVASHLHSSGTLIVAGHTHSVPGSTTQGSGDHKHGVTGTTGLNSGGGFNADQGSNATTPFHNHTHGFSADTDQGSGHSHTVPSATSGSAAPDVAGNTGSATAATVGSTDSAGGAAITGASASANNNPLYVDFYACRKD